MHPIEPRVEVEPTQSAAAEEQGPCSSAVAANQSDLEGGIQRNDGPHVAIVLNSVMRASSALLEATRGAVRSSSSSISGAETEIELTPYSRCSFCDGALTQQAGDGSKPRGGISTAPTLHSRSSTPSGTRPQKETPETDEPAPREDTATSCVFTRWLESFQKFWDKHISVRVPGKAARDHLAIERTFLAYHRTSMVFALIGTVVAQLQILNHKPNTNPAFGYYVLGKPLAVTLVAFSIAFSIMGWWRWYTWQRNTIRGEVVVGGWELQSVGLVMILFLLAIFGVLLGLLIEKVFFT